MLRVSQMITRGSRMTKMLLKNIPPFRHGFAIIVEKKNCEVVQYKTLWVGAVYITTEQKLEAGALKKRRNGNLLRLLADVCISKFHLQNAQCTRSIRAHLEVLITMRKKMCCINRGNKSEMLYLAWASLYREWWKWCGMIVRWKGRGCSYELTASVHRSILSVTSSFNIWKLTVWLRGASHCLERGFLSQCSHSACTFIFNVPSSTSVIKRICTHAKPSCGTRIRRRHRPFELYFNYAYSFSNLIVFVLILGYFKRDFSFPLCFMIWDTGTCLRGYALVECVLHSTVGSITRLWLERYLKFSSVTLL